ncbi:hypothetical protein RHMOL_Rhmol05G0181700 [Rhododendron molle]|uniref:Uncharacterized protein n=1 Tax=Rhododendron molle TaxID=49168 RepID=A0ACC0NSV5_RHOML|nr:hypothetical protein RHMOL_Rhmol05G0181700 [Rhododendron molle]
MVEHPLKEHRINGFGFIAKRVNMGVNMMEQDMQLVIGTHLQLHKCIQTKHFLGVIHVWLRRRLTKRNQMRWRITKRSRMRRRITKRNQMRRRAVQTKTL